VRSQGFLYFSGDDLSDTLRAAWIEIWVVVGGMDVRTLGVSIGGFAGFGGVFGGSWGP